MTELRRIDALIAKLEASLIKTKNARRRLLDQASEVKQELDLLSDSFAGTPPAERKHLKLNTSAYGSGSTGLPANERDPSRTTCTSFGVKSGGNAASSLVGSLCRV